MREETTCFGHVVAALRVPHGYDANSGTSGRHDLGRVRRKRIVGTLDDRASDLTALGLVPRDHAIDAHDAVFGTRAESAGVTWSLGPR